MPTHRGSIYSAYGGERPRALELARKAEEIFRAKAATYRKELAEVSAWFARRRRPSSQ